MKHKLKHMQCSEKRRTRKDVPVQSSSAWCNIKYDGTCLGDKEGRNMSFPGGGDLERKTLQNLKLKVT